MIISLFIITLQPASIPIYLDNGVSFAAPTRLKKEHKSSYVNQVVGVKTTHLAPGVDPTCLYKNTR